MKVGLVLFCIISFPFLVSAQMVKLERLDYEVPSNLKADLDPGSQNQNLYPDRKKKNKSASYTTFWIYPDGNFNFLDFEPNITTLTNSYVTVDKGGQKIYCYLTEKYINSEPPEDAVMNEIEVKTTSLLPEDNNFSTDLNLYINNDPRPDYKMVVAASYKKRSTADRLYLFYNNVGLARAGYELFQTNPEHILPQYYSDRGGVTHLSPPYSDELADFNDYKNSVFFDLSNLEISKPPAPFERERIFTVLKTMPSRSVEGYPFGQYANLVGVLVGKDQFPISIGEVNIARDLKIGKIEQESLESGIVSLGDYYLYGIDTLLRPIAETHDPNELRLIKICHDENNLIIDYELDICNDFPLIEDKIDLALTGINGYVIKNIKISSHNSRSSRPSMLTTAPFIFDPEMSLSIADHEEPECGTVKFTVTIPYDGNLDRAEQILSSKKGFIQYCVTFNNTRDKIQECNTAFSYNAVDNSYKIDLCPTEPTPVKFTWHWWYFLIFIAIAPVVWKFIYKKKKDGSADDKP